MKTLLYTKSDYRRQAKAENKVMFHLEIRQPVRDKTSYEITGICESDDAKELLDFYNDWEKRRIQKILKREVKIFALNDCDWFAGRNLQECIDLAIQEWDYGQESYEDAEEIPETAYQTLLYQKNGEGLRDGEEITFRARLDELIDNGEKFPCFFATTEY